MQKERRLGIDLGDPDCPICHGIGYYRYDVVLSDPNFGLLKDCPCRQSELDASRRRQSLQLSNLGELTCLTFENFEARGHLGLGSAQADSIEQAFNSAQNFAGTLKGWLLLTGGYGTGKTHLAAAVANQALQVGIGCIFMTVPDLLDWLRASFSEATNESFDERLEQLRTIPLLVLDDYGTQSFSTWAQEKVFQILNQRYSNQLATLITSNVDMNDFEGRIRSRLSDPRLVTHVHITAPDYRTPSDEFGHPDLSCLNLYSKQTFQSFQLRNNDRRLQAQDHKSLREALDAAEAFAKDPQGWLLFQGGYGCGKTHLAAAIGNYQAGLGRPPLMVGVPDLLDYLRAAFSPNSAISLDRRFAEISRSQLLILDDLSTQSATPWAREKMYQLFNRRYAAELPTVITSSALPSELDPRLKSRLQDQRLCKTLIMTAPGFTGDGV